MRKLIFLFCVWVKIYGVHSLDWSFPFFEEVPTPEVKVEGQSEAPSTVHLIFDEEVPVGFTLGYLKIDGSATPEMGSRDKFSVEKIGEKFALVSKYKFDYESSDSKEINVTVYTNEVSVDFTIKINNINDNEFKITSVETCKIPENNEPPSMPCMHTLTDEDGFSEHLELNNFEEQYSNMFEFSCNPNCIGQKVATVYTTAKVPLDYEKVQKYEFLWKVNDEVHHAQTNIQVEVEDMPDERPVWDTITYSNKFDEEEPQVFIFGARDGDRGINSPIEYCCIDVDALLEPLMTCGDDVGDLNQMKIDVQAIDRDKDEISLLTFKVKACEKLAPKDCTTEEIVFLINDLNDNIPTITVDKNELEFAENTYESLSERISIAIKDLDSGLLGTFDVSLECDVPEVKTAMQIIPSVGYRDATFSLAILKADILDYDRTDKFRQFDIKIVAIERADTAHRNEAIIKIKLTNWNDEEPIFDQESYTVEVSELYGRLDPEKLVIKDLRAIDLDIDDYVTYEIIGSGIKNILELRHTPQTDDDPEIYTIKQANEFVQLFDFETQPEVTFQVKASDNLATGVTQKRNKFAEVTIKLTDVNDETPLVHLSLSSIQVLENCADGYELPGVLVIATDADANAILEVNIDWDESYATKYGQKIKLFKDLYTGSFYLEKQTRGGVESTYTVHVKDKVQCNTPDYEEFDTIYLIVTVKDTDQTWGINTNKATLIITVKDINDNLPEFVEEIMTVDFKVTENSKIGTIVGMVAATDKDVADMDKLIFTITEKPGTDTPPGLVSVDSNSIKVASTKIDADNRVDEYLHYEICVDDGFEELPSHIVCMDLDIFVTDENDETPTFVDEPVDCDIKEHSPVGFQVVQIKATDKDRDEPNKIIAYYFEKTNDFFSISEDDGWVSVKKDLDREGAQKTFEVKVVVKDNPGARTHNQISGSFMVTLTDINDQEPIIKTDEIETREDVEIGGVVGTIVAEDGDEAGSDNAKIDFKILELIGCYGELAKDYFRIQTDQDHLSGEGTITAVKSLRKFYGDCKIKIFTSDFGTDPSQLTYTKEVNLKIGRFNFEDPIFTYPTKKAIYLKPKQESDENVKGYDDVVMPPFKAEHERENKYNIEFTLAADSDGLDTFYFKKDKMTTAYLALKPGYDNSRQYNVKIVATDDGVPSKSATIELKIGFYDTDAEPVFPEDQRTIVIDFDETMQGVGSEFDIPKASLEVEDEEIVADIDTYYYIMEDRNNAFGIDKGTGKLTLVKPLFVLNLTSTELKVIASKSDSITNGNSNGSILTITLNVSDINDNPPTFKQKDYGNGVRVGYEKTKVILTFEATDLDAETIFNYTIDYSTYDAIGTAISKDLHKFDLDQLSGDLTLNFEVQSNMKGYFIFEVIVFDGLWTDTANAKIYIISDENEVLIRYENNVTDVLPRKLQIEATLSEVLEYSCNVQGITDAADDNGNAIAEVSEVKFHCVEEATNLPVDTDIIKAQINNYKVYGQLRAAFLKFGLSLVNVIEKPVAENKEEQLKIWLIAVSVVLGSVCALLVVAFILKTRSLTTRISKLTTVDFTIDDGNTKTDANMYTPSAPTTNRRAVEGSNPVFNTNFDDREMNDYDKESISSGDSDFAGVENNPVFMN